MASELHPSISPRAARCGNRPNNSARFVRACSSNELGDTSGEEPVGYRSRAPRHGFRSAPLMGRHVGEKEAMRHGPAALLIVFSTACVSPIANAHSEARIDIGMLNPVDVNTTSIASDVSVVKNDFPLLAYRLPPVVHGPTYYPAWRGGESRGSGWFEYLGGGRFLLHERDDYK